MSEILNIIGSEVRDSGGESAIVIYLKEMILKEFQKSQLNFVF